MKRRKEKHPRRPQDVGDTRAHQDGSARVITTIAADKARKEVGETDLNSSPATTPSLVTELRQLIDTSRQRAASAVNVELTLLYWQVGLRINREILGEQRADYGEKIVAELSRQLTSSMGEAGAFAIYDYASVLPGLFPTPRLCTHCVPN